jgi:glyoxylase-like metal-dependent hydrolase (beta-lactamase superfamily II)
MEKPYIIPIDVGNMEWDHSEAVLRRGMGIKVKGNFICWYIGGTDVPILVDSGLPSEERAQKWHSYTNPTVNVEQQVENALKKKDIDPESIKIIIQTHLHWDHVGNLDLFPNAQIIVSDKELMYALNPFPIHFAAYEAFALGIEPLWIKAMGRFKIVRMAEQEVATGVRIIPTPGHTLGFMSVLLETADGPYVMAGDTVMQVEALNPEPDKKLPFNVPGVYTDLIALWESTERILDLVGGERKRVLPGHDRLVFQQERYPK